MEGTYAIVIDGFGNVTERYLGDDQQGIQLTQQIKVISNTVPSNTNRILVLQRSLTVPGFLSLFFFFFF